ncbi:MAG: hypothetical protein AAFY26_00775 [Cyanobacteria bacterium J06638_22]
MQTDKTASSESDRLIPYLLRLKVLVGEQQFTYRLLFRSKASEAEATAEAIAFCEGIENSMDCISRAERTQFHQWRSSPWWYFGCLAYRVMSKAAISESTYQLLRQLPHNLAIEEVAPTTELVEAVKVVVAE